MKKILALVLSALFAATPACMAQTPDKDAQAVASTVETLRNAMQSANRVALENLAAENLVYTHSSGKMQNKAEFVQGIAGGDSVFVTLQFTDLVIKVTGDTAIVQHKLVANTNDRGKGPAKVNIGVMLVFQKQNSAWKLLGRQAYKL